MSRTGPGSQEEAHQDCCRLAMGVLRLKCDAPLSGFHFLQLATIIAVCLLQRGANNKRHGRFENSSYENPLQSSKRDTTHGIVWQKALIPLYVRAKRREYACV